MIKKVLIVGGGSSGWMTAAYLDAAINKKGTQKKISIELVESPDIPRISVGEATVPSIRHLLATIGVTEVDFMKSTDATFKQAIKYVNWVDNDNSFYYHPFNRFSPKPLDTLAHHWILSDKSIPFGDICSAQPQICELALSPKTLSESGWGSPFSHAYHMNAQKFADYLRDISVSRGVNHVLANVTDVEMKSDKQIKAVNTDNAGRLEADLFIDCTGFRAKLIEEKLGVGFEDCSQWLLCDRAVAMHVPYDKYYPGMVRPYTTATALSNGWVWDIPMQSQRSLGYVHSSAFISKEAAERELRAYQGGSCDELPARFVDFKVGRRHKAWEGNCIAIGLSGGFIEPLESTGLYLSDTGVVMLAEHFPFDESTIDDMSFRYNRILSNRFYEILDFINMHYCLTRRVDTEFWRTVQKPEHITDRLKAKLEFWKIKPPSPLDFEDQSFMGYDSKHLLQGGDNRSPIDNAGLWSHLSYQNILFGMKFEEQMHQANSHSSIPSVIHPMVRRRLEVAKSMLPTHEHWLRHSLDMPEYSVSSFPDGWV
ncbi:tryptophan halogenase family protein [Kangiella koreensis]|uniref:Tryptophan halogenase n=1 Tax=Kangiella koreensis (strain DSM 16069 / JCM 12317 / KCTC 12182 / SW-125) TaxID=523791 RepID=C7RB81_KANKD|nr:tryptophan halogenase family protein [Kangiella koreensis]ACV26523.1 tryptophan halogenase [Kangiella koreensis DSM 16069]